MPECLWNVNQEEEKTAMCVINSFLLHHFSPHCRFSNSHSWSPSFSALSVQFEPPTRYLCWWVNFPFFFLPHSRPSSNKRVRYFRFSIFSYFRRPISFNLISWIKNHSLCPFLLHPRHHPVALFVVLCCCIYTQFWEFKRADLSREWD